MPPALDLDALRRGDRRVLARAITLVESVRDDHRRQAEALLEAVLPHTGSSIRIGVTGAPGVGKSTFIEAFGLHLINEGKRVAVLAVDPSSPRGGGSILGDKTRMERLSRRPEAYIRPSPAGGALGGVAGRTRETMLLCEAAGHDVALVETVGVGQSEHQVADMVDFFMVLLLPNAGDELQGIKKGIIELADALLINKADGAAAAMAEVTQGHYAAALGLLRHAPHWRPPALTCSATEGAGIAAAWDMIRQFKAAADRAGAFQARRRQQARDWLRHLLNELLRLKLSANAQAKSLLAELEERVVACAITPHAAARRVIGCM